MTIDRRSPVRQVQQQQQQTGYEPLVTPVLFTAPPNSLTQPTPPGTSSAPSSGTRIALQAELDEALTLSGRTCPPLPQQQQQQWRPSHQPSSVGVPPPPGLS
jgi:hypothetical protein